MSLVRSHMKPSHETTGCHLGFLLNSYSESSLASALLKPHWPCFSRVTTQVIISGFFCLYHSHLPFSYTSWKLHLLYMQVTSSLCTSSHLNITSLEPIQSCQFTFVMPIYLCEWCTGAKVWMGKFEDNLQESTLSF